MKNRMQIRTSVNGDLSAIETLYPDAFPDEDLLPLVSDLLRDAQTTLSLVAIIRSVLVGHVMFTRCGVGGHSIKLALLGPLAVATAWQRKGIGSALVRNGLHQLESDSVTQVCVLGDPTYYERLGFMPETNIIPPYSLPVEWQGAWQSISLGKTEARLQGKLSLPSTWLRPDLWSP